MKCFHLLRDTSTVDVIVCCLQSEPSDTLALVPSPLLFSQQLVAGVRGGVDLLVRAQHGKAALLGDCKWGSPQKGLWGG